MQESIDLRLAVNYVPGCICLGKTGLMLGLLACVRVFNFVPAYTLLLLNLVVDRMRSSCRIIDTNGVVLCILYSEVLQQLREMHDPWWSLWPGTAYGVSLAWSAFGIYVMLEMPGVVYLRGFRGAFLITGGFAFLLSMCWSPGEHWIIRIVRGMTFSLLCILWTYVVGIHRKRLVSPADSAMNFAVFFSPVLFVHDHVAMLFGAVALQRIVVVMLPSRRGDEEQQQHCESRADDCCGHAERDPEAPAEQSMDELEELYRLMKGSKSIQ